MRQRMCSTLLMFAVASCAVSSVEPLSVPLSYKSDPRPQQVLEAYSCPVSVQVQVDDQRAEKILGERILEGKPQKAEVTTAGDPVNWVRNGVEDYLSRSGIKLGQGPKLNLQLETLRTSETVWHRAGYDARIGLEAQLKSPSGKTCWQSSIAGKSGNYGYAGSIDNYQETLNGALDDAASHVVDAAGFKNALCQCGE